MSYQWGLFKNIFVVRWKVLTAPDLDIILRDMANAWRSVGKPLIYITELPVDAPTPSADQRSALNKFTESAKQYCDSFHMIIPGDSIRRTIQRTVITGVMMLVGQKLQINKTMDEAVEQAAHAASTDPAELLRQVRSRGLAD